MATTSAPTQFFPELLPYGYDPNTLKPQWSEGGEQFKEYYRKVSYWVEAAYEEARWEQAQSEEVRNISKYINYISGKQWPRQRPSYKASPIDNRIWRLMWEMVSLLTDIRPVFEVKTHNKLYEKQASIVNKATRAWWMGSDADLKLSLIIIYAILTTGYGKLWWNSELQGGQGDFELTPLGPSSVLPLKPHDTLQSSQAVIYQTAMPLGWFRRRFPLRGHTVLPDLKLSRYGSAGPTAPAHIPQMLFNFLSPAMQRTVGQEGQQSSSVYPMATYREFWIKDWTYNNSNNTLVMAEPGTNWCYSVKPNEMLYPRGRLIITGGRTIVYDGPNPYWHGEFPFEVLRMNVVPWQFMGASDLAPLIPLQDVINNILAGILDMIKKAVNPPFYAPKNAFPDAVWNSLDWGMPGAKIGYNQSAAPGPQFPPAPVLPAFVMNALMLVGREMDQSSGIAAVSEAVRKKQVPSGETLERIREVQQTPIRLKGRNIEIFLRGLGRKNIWNIFQFYSAKRRMYMMGPDGTTFEDFDWDPESCVPAGMEPRDFAKHFSFLIHPGSLLNVNRIERAVMLMRMRMMNDMSRKSLFKELDLGIDVDQVEKELEEEQRRKIGGLMQAAMMQAMPGLAQRQTGSKLSRQVRLPRA